jgi:hypothetical protein
MVRHGHPLFGLEIYRWQSDEWMRDSRADAMPRVPVTSASIAGLLGPGESKTACFRDEVSCLDGWQLVDIPFPLESGTYKLLLYVMLDNDPGGVIRLYSEPMITIVK